MQVPCSSDTHTASGVSPEAVLTIWTDAAVLSQAGRSNQGLPVDSTSCPLLHGIPRLDGQPVYRTCQVLRDLTLTGGGRAVGRALMVWGRPQPRIRTNQCSAQDFSMRSDLIGTEGWTAGWPQAGLSRLRSAPLGNFQ